MTLSSSSSFSPFAPFAIFCSKLSSLLLLLVFLSSSPPAFAEDAVCARVKIEVQQSLTLERQAFDAHMRVNNGLHIPLEDIDIDVEFTDAGGTNAEALFYIDVSSMEDISDIEGAGEVSANTSADIHWLIIPSPGAGGETEQGTLYYVGATLSYTVDGETNVTEVAPDFIYVKPMPDLIVDYFLAGEVYGDDPFTSEVTEPSLPFTMGIRVKNGGYGPANALKLDVGQPEIRENVNGLLVGFQIQDSEVNGVEGGKTMLVDFGNVEPGEASVARWTMKCDLCGSFTNFNASFSHSDELGGELTSLIEQTNVAAHILKHDVLVDLPGRDSIRDFLSDSLNVYESDGVENLVTNMSFAANLAGADQCHTLTVSQATVGPIYVQLDNPEDPDQVLLSVTRSDGKELNNANFWISMSKQSATSEWDYYFNLFDVNASNCTYSVLYQSESSLNHAPVIFPIGAKTVVAGSLLGFAVSADDSDSDPITLSTGSLPDGASFTNNGDGTGLFRWTPTQQKVGSYTVKFLASDGVTEDTETILLTVQSAAEGPWPQWWIARSVLERAVGTVTNDYAAANQGQVKHLASMAWDQLNSMPVSPGFTLSLTNADNYAAVNLGQLKELAAPFYDHLGTDYPWSGATNTNDYAIANIGQLKNLFDFDPEKDTDGDGMPDWWETKHSLNPNDDSDGQADADEDGKTNLYEYMHDSDPQE